MSRYKRRRSRLTLRTLAAVLFSHTLRRLEAICTSIADKPEVRDEKRIQITLRSRKTPFYFSIERRWVVSVVNGWSAKCSRVPNKILLPLYCRCSPACSPPVLLPPFFILPPSRATLSLQQLLLRGAFDLILVACIHVVTVCSIRRLIREYVEPSAGILAVHLGAVVVCIPLIISLNAERSL